MPLTSRDKTQYYTVHIHTRVYTSHIIYIYAYTRYRNRGAENIISSLSKI